MVHKFGLGDAAKIAHMVNHPIIRRDRVLFSRAVGAMLLRWCIDCLTERVEQLEDDLEDAYNETDSAQGEAEDYASEVYELEQQITELEERVSELENE